MRFLKQNLLIQSSVLTAAMMMIVAVIVSSVLDQRLNHNLDLLTDYGHAMMTGVDIKATDQLGIPGLIKDMENSRWIAWGAIGGASLVLYGSVLAIAWKAWTTASRQRRQLESSAMEFENQIRERTADLLKSNLELVKEITERKQAEAELQALTASLERRNRQLEQFAFVASHDIQEPLRKLRTYGDRLKSGYGHTLADRGQDYLQRMLNATGRMQTLIDDLSTFSRVTTKAEPFVPVDLSVVAEQVLVDLNATIKEVGGRVEVAELPTIDADPIQMRQLIQNLVSNSLKFHRKTQPLIVRVRSQISDALSNPVVTLEVADNGIGFDERYLGRIFNVFQRLHGRDTYSGAGIGLAVCRKIVERHRGTITAKSRPGQGATFLVTLPVNQPQGDN